MATSIFERILYGIKVSNDNILVLNDKLDKILKVLAFEQKSEDIIMISDTDQDNI